MNKHYNTVCHLIFMRCHDNACHVMLDQLESHSITLPMKGGTANTPNVTLPPPPQHKKCLKTSDHLMYNLNNLTDHFTRRIP